VTSLARCHAAKLDGSPCRAWSMLDARVCYQHRQKPKTEARGQVCPWCGKRIDKRFVSHRGCIV
jgi:hypothetical protein